jgi:hypothetical protein
MLIYIIGENYVMINNTILVIFAVTAAFALITATLLVPAQAKVRAKIFCGKEASGINLCAQNRSECEPFKASGFIRNCHAVPIHQ